MRNVLKPILFVSMLFAMSSAEAGGFVGVHANIAPLVAVEVELASDATWSSSGTVRALVGPRIRVFSNTGYHSFQETSALGIALTVTCQTAGAMCSDTATSTAAEREYTVVLSQVIDYQPRTVDAADTRIDIIQTFIPAGI